MLIVWTPKVVSNAHVDQDILAMEHPVLVSVVLMMLHSICCKWFGKCISSCTIYVLVRCGYLVAFVRYTLFLRSCYVMLLFSLKCYRIKGQFLNRLGYCWYLLCFHCLLFFVQNLFLVLCSKSVAFTKEIKIFTLTF